MTAVNQTGVREPEGESCVVLHYVGYRKDGGGILATVRSVAAEQRFRSLLGVAPDFEASNSSMLELWRGPDVQGESIGPGNALRCWRVALRVRSWLQEDARRIFHGHSRAGLLVALWLALLGQRRVVATVHCLGRQRWFYRVAARVLGSRLYWLGPAMKRHYGLAEESWSNCVPDAVPLAAFRGVRRIPAIDGGWRIGCAGALVPVKEWELALAALAKLGPEGNARLRIAGEPDGSAESAAYARELRRLAEQWGVAQRVEWCGYMSDIATFYSELDVLLVASRWEAFSVAALEAAAAGVPVAAPAESGTSDLLGAGAAGRTYRAGDADDLAECLRTIRRMKPAIEDAVQILQRFTAPRVAEEWAQIYAEIILSSRDSVQS